MIIKKGVKREFDIEKVKEQIKKGKNQRELCEIFFCDRKTMAKFLKNNNLVLLKKSKSIQPQKKQKKTIEMNNKKNKAIKHNWENTNGSICKSVLEPPVDPEALKIMRRKPYQIN